MAENQTPGRATATASVDGSLEAVSPAFAAVLRRSIDGLARRNLIDLVHPDDTAVARQVFAAAAIEPVQQLTNLRLWTGDERWQQTSLTFRRVGDGLLILTVASTEMASSAPRHEVSSSANSTSVAGAQIPAQRAAIRAAVGVANPVVEIDIDGHTTFVSGQWDLISPEAGGGVEAFERLLEGSGQADAILDALGNTFDHEQSSRFEVAVAGLGARWVHLLPIPSPLRAGVTHALVAVTASPDLASTVETISTVATEPAVPVPVKAAASPMSVPLPIAAVRAPAATAVAAPSAPAAADPSIAQTSSAQTSSAQTSIAQTSIAQTSIAQTSIAQTSIAQTSIAQTSTTETSAAETSASLTAGTSQSASTTGAVVAERAGDRVVSSDPSTAESARSSNLADRLAQISSWVSGRGLTWNQVGAVGAVLFLALLLRTWNLVGLPTGFHGDEAITGQEAQRVLENGSIGIYTGSALGQPTAPFYINAIFVGLFGPTIWATRIVAALAGVLSVLATYLIVQRRFDHVTALASAFALATMTWSIHFSRIAFGVAWWPLVVLVAIAAIDRATQVGGGRAWFVAGALSAFGVYVYNSHWSFGFAVAACMVVWLLWRHERKVQRGQALIWGPLGAFMVLLPMWRYAADERNGYFNHFNLVNRRNTPEWTEAGFFGKADVLLGWYFQSWKTLLFSPTGDGVDASGIIKQVPLIFTVLAVIGLGVALSRKLSAFTGLLLATMIVVPIAPSMTVDALTRRNFAIAPCIAIFAGIGAAWVFDVVRSRGGAQGVQVAVVAIVVVTMFTSVLPYFTTFADSEGQKWVFAEELTATDIAVERAEEDGPVFVNWYSGRHYFEYQTLEFLLDGTLGTNRTPLDLGFVENPSLELFADTELDQLYVFVGEYTRNVEALRLMYPEGRIILTDDDPRIVAYEVPAGAG